MRWRNYLLLEVVIAMALVASVAPLVMKCCFRAVERKQALQRDLVTTRKAEIAFCTIKQLLYEGGVPWRKVYSGHTYPGSLADPATDYKIRVAHYWYKRPTATQPSSTWRLLEITLELDSHSFTYYLMVQRLGPRKEK